jgi:endonuclease-3
LLAALKARYPDAHCELDWTKPHELLIATILSAQCTDVAVNKATPGLFRAFPTPADYARATQAEIEPPIRSIGLFRSKARAVHETCRTLVERFRGEVPRTMEELLLLQLGGVGFLFVIKRTLLCRQLQVLPDHLLRDRRPFLLFGVA